MSHGEVPAPLFVGLQTGPEPLVSGQALERDQPPGDVVRSLVWQEIPQQVAAAPRNDASPVGGVLPEGLALKGIDLVADDAGDAHVLPSFEQAIHKVASCRFRWFG